MGHQRAQTIVSVPLHEIEDLLADVTRWPEFLHEVAVVTRTGRHDYIFTMKDGRQRARHVHVAHDERLHRFAWSTRRHPDVGDHPHPGPLRSGSVTLTPVDERLTRIELCLVDYPTGFFGSVFDMFSTGDTKAVIDLQLLEHRLHESAAGLSGHTISA